jgi:hypothetical protein
MVLEGDLFHGLLIEGHAVRDWFLHLHLLIDILFVRPLLSGCWQWRWRRRVWRRTKVVVFLMLKENVLLDVLVYLFWQGLSMNLTEDAGTKRNVAQHKRQEKYILLHLTFK